MRRFSVVYLILVFILIIYYSCGVSDYHKVLKIVSATEFYVDFNNNNVADINELVVLKDFTYRDLPFSKSDILRLKYLGKTFAQEHLLNRYVKVNNEPNDTFSVVFFNNQNYSELLVSNGIVLSDDNKPLLLEKLNEVKKIDLVAYNKTTGKYHDLDCKYVSDSSFFEIIKSSDINKNIKPCKICIVPKVSVPKYPKDVYEQFLPVYKDNFIEFYVTDFTRYFYPSKKCLTSACRVLLKEINNAKDTIDFAIYGIDGQPEIINALISAKDRGVKIRWVYDVDAEGTTIYKESLTLAMALTDSRKDIDLIIPENNTASTRDSIMHNKFFIFDNKKVWTGSANISKTDLAGFNANSVLLINSDVITGFYKSEFEKMYNGTFHRIKTNTQQNVTQLGASDLSVYFSPKDNIVQNYLLPLVENAKTYIYIPVFVITHKNLNDSLIRAVNRGIDVRLIVDSTSAGNKYSSVKYLRDNGVKVKVENLAGKMHMKSIMIDDEYSIIGSMNFTKSGEKYNDENVVIIKNQELTKSFKKIFLYFWSFIPDKWLYSNPITESSDSINSCFDGIDNDFDGKIDNADEGCRIKS